MNMIPLGVASQAARELAQSALPDAPTVTDEPVRRGGVARHAVAAGLRWAANRLEPRPAADRFTPETAC
jgi:hypothetical protein